MKNGEERPPTLREQLVALIPKLQMHALALTRSKQTAEDLVQNTHLRALETLHQWTGRGRFDGWVGKVMDSIWSNELRRQRRRPEAELPEPDLIVAGGFENQVQEKLLIIMLHARSNLSDEDFSWLAKVYVYDYTFTELAEEQAVPRGTALARVHRIKAVLRKIAKQSDPPESS
jgi:RNA polymerase sigma-70 factor (ECF subfamily)